MSKRGHRFPFGELPYGVGVFAEMSDLLLLRERFKTPMWTG